jgi:hypothetical protein
MFYFYFILYIVPHYCLPSTFTAENAHKSTNFNLQATKESKKFCPEAISFLQSLLVTSLEGEVGNQVS